MALMCLATTAQGAFLPGMMSAYFDVFQNHTGALYALGNGFAQLPGVISVITVGPIVASFGWLGVFALAFLVSLCSALVFACCHSSEPLERAVAELPADAELGKDVKLLEHRSSAPTAASGGTGADQAVRLLDDDATEVPLD